MSTTTIFPPSTATSANAMAVDVPPFVVWTSACTPNADPTKAPSYANWVAQPSLEAVEVLKSSSPVGMSHARLRVSPGAPTTSDTVRVENAVPVGQGDRVLIGLDEGGAAPRWLFGGYVVRADINVSAEREVETIDLAGPEWIWGAGGPGTGAAKVVCGQVRRLSAADDAFVPAFVAGGTYVTNPSNLAQLTDLRAVFNPQGRKNMSRVGALFGSNAAAVVGGDLHAMPWETEDRKAQNVELSDQWTKDQACLSLYLWYNDPAASGITLDPSVMPTHKPIRHTDVDGLGLWEALVRVCGAEWGFYVDPTPDASAALGNNSFQGFTLRFFDRASGPAANLVLNPLGTAGASASFSVSRLEATKDARKVCNKVRVLTNLVRHVKLQYFGSHTTATSATEKKCSLQHGWTKGDDTLKTYAAKDAQGNWVVTPETVEAAGTGHLSDWVTKYRAHGSDYAAHAHVFRLFTWNEAGEWMNGGSDADTLKPLYGTNDAAGTTLAYYAPDLTGIADGPGTGQAGKYCRRRRKLQDTGYWDTSGDVDSWRRVRPTLYLRAATPSSDTNYGAWIRVPTSCYHVDEERGTVRITHEDLAEWRPFIEAAQAADILGDAEGVDGRSFATLLLTGKLRMLLECSVESDWQKEYLSDVTAAAGVPLIREAVVRADQDYYYTESFADGVASPGSLTLTPRDDGLFAQEFADNAKLRGQDQRTHASILVEADWPEQPIGTMVQSTAGRVVNLTVNGTGKGAQVVAVLMSASDMKWELLTETAALKLRQVSRQEIDRHRAHRRQLGDRPPAEVPLSMRLFGTTPGPYVAAPHADDSLAGGAPSAVAEGY